MVNAIGNGISSKLRKVRTSVGNASTANSDVNRRFTMCSLSNPCQRSVKGSCVWTYPAAPFVHVPVVRIEINQIVANGEIYFLTE